MLGCGLTFDGWWAHQIIKSFIRPEEPDRILEEVFVRKLGVTKERLLDSGLSLEQFRQV